MMRFTQIRDYLLIMVGASLQAVAFFLFLVPGQLAPGGLSGVAQIVNSFTGWPIGAMVLVMNIPLFVLGWKFLGGHRFFVRTIVASVVFSVVLDALGLFFPPGGVTDDQWLNALYGALLGGVGGGLVIRARATSGGTEIVARLISRRYGIPLSQSYLWTDSVIVFLSGLAFSWSHALYALIVLYLWGIVTDYVLEGQSVVRAAIIITSQPEQVAAKVMEELERGVTAWAGTGMYSGRGKQVLYCVITRTEVQQLKSLINEADPDAFVVIGHAHEALGEGFKKLAGEK
ncbi:MAG TPA: YitT family protein [Anaerolineales bacterium]|nr:YitT family protein [Anaerolineales bacterium]